MAEQRDAGMQVGIADGQPVVRYTVHISDAYADVGKLAMAVREVRYLGPYAVQTALDGLPEGAKLEVLHEFENGPAGLMVKGHHVTDEQFMALMVRDVIAPAKDAGEDVPGMDAEIGIHRQWWGEDPECGEVLAGEMVPWCACGQDDEGAFAITFIWDDAWGDLLADA